MLNYVDGINADGLHSELSQHAKEEFDHFGKLVDFAGKFGLQDRLTFDIDYDFVGFTPLDLEDVISFNLEKEKKAYELYYKGVSIAEEEGDSETEDFFKELAIAEKGHYDDLATFLSKTRSLGE